MAAELLHTLRQKFFDSNGEPLAGGKLYSYAAGTTTPQVTYTDQGGGTPNANPTILDANGEADIWIGTGSYKFVLKDADDVTQWTVDNVQSLRALIADTVNEEGALAVTNNLSDLDDVATALTNLGIASATMTFTNKTFDAEGTGNAISNIKNSNIKAAAAIALDKLAATTASRALVSDGSGFVSPATTTSTEIGYLNGVTSSIQTQLDAKIAKSLLTAKGGLIGASAASTPGELAPGTNGYVLTADSTEPLGFKWSAAHDGLTAVNIDFTPAGTIAATDTQAAIEELDDDIQAHLSDAADAHDASAISVSPAGALGSTDVQAALEELQADITGLSAPSFAYTAETAGATLAVGEYAVMSGASGNVTLPTAASQAGKSIYIEHGGTSLTQKYTIQTTSSQTIGGVAGGSYVLCTAGEVLHVVSDGTNWRIANHKAETDWASYTAGLTGFGSETNNEYAWRRSGRNIFIRGSHTNGTVSATAGKFGIPSNTTLATSLMGTARMNSFGQAWTTTTAATGIPVNSRGPYTIALTSGDTDVLTICDFVDADVGVFGPNNASTWSSTGGKVSVVTFAIPISDWQP